MKPLVAIVGRPNVGKSTFFNRMIGKRQAIVEDVPGVTRDRIHGDVQWRGRTFTLIDTGGLDPRSEDVFLSKMRHQAELAVEMADAILFMVDGRAGVTADDSDVADFLRRTGKSVILLVNKLDSPQRFDDAMDFYTLGIGEPMAISSANLLGFGDVCDAIYDVLPPWTDEEEEGAPIEVAVVGKPNAGKSSLVNRLLGEERVMVSDIAGTTRDAIDTPFEFAGQRFTLIDTAGIRRKRNVEEGTIERYSVIRALASIRRCHVAVLVVDALSGITEQDQRIAGYIRDEGRACVVVVNKWDAVDKETGTFEKTKREVLASLKFMDYASVLLISALTGKRAEQVMPAVLEAYAQFTRRVTTGMLNDALHDILAVTPPPVDRGRRLKIYYATQQAIKPPTFVLFCNDPDLMHYGYERHLENELRHTFGFEGTPIRLFARAREEKDASTT